MERHFASNNTIEPSSWESSLPTVKEILEMQSVGSISARYITCINSGNLSLVGGEPT